jgi:hypothetical protein
MDYPVLWREAQHSRAMAQIPSREGKRPAWRLVHFRAQVVILNMHLLGKDISSFFTIASHDDLLEGGIP